MRRGVLIVIVASALGCYARARDDAPARRPVPPEVYEHYLRGRVAAIEGDHPRAIAEFRLAAALMPGNAELRVAVAEELLANGMTARAQDELNGILSRWPGDAGAWLLQGRVHGRAGRLRDSVSAFERAVELAPKDEDAYLLLAAAHRQLDDARAAERVYARLVAAVPLSVVGHYRLGRALLVRREHDEARERLARAVELDPGHIEARVALAEALRRAGKTKEASATLREAFDRSGDDPAVGERLFAVLLDGGDQAGALELVRSLDASWRDGATRVALGYLFVQLRRGDEALAVADAVLARDDTAHDARILRGRALVQLGRAADAIEAFSAVPAESDEYPEARIAASEVTAQDGHAKQALALVEDALARWPGDPGLVAQRASLLEKLGDVARARELLDDALAKTSGQAGGPGGGPGGGHDELVYARASLEERSGDPERGVEIMRKLLEAGEDNVLALNFIGYSYANRGVKLDEAERLLARALALRPDDGYVLDSWGWLLVQQGKLDDARAALERADRLSPFEPEILLHLGELHVRRGDDASAKDAFTRALALDPDDRTRLRLEQNVKTLEARRKP